MKLNLQIFQPRAKNSMTLPQQFLRYGNKKVMTPDWTGIVMSDRDHYSGYGFAAITRRARKVAQIALENVHTKAEDENFVHPYLDIITKSKTFSNYKFWEAISTYLDLEGVYYLMAIRNVSNNRVGEIQEFKLLNPYYVRRVLDPNKLEVQGYVEQRGGLYREIPKEMIIDIREINPFNEFEPFAMTDAAKESQFTLKTAGDYTRHSLRNNINAAGIMSTDVVLEEEDFKRFVKRVQNHEKGEPIFSNGGGAVKWDDMQVALKDAALGEVRETSRDELFSTFGQSKTIMGLEQSGTTRETANVQKELNMEYQIVPRIQLIIDAMNQDYINFDDRYKDNDATLIVENPMEADYDTDIKSTLLKTNQLALYQSLVNKDIDLEIAAKFVKGEIGIEALKIEKQEVPDFTPPPDNTDGGDNADDSKNGVKKNFNSYVSSSQATLKNELENIQARLVAIAITNMKKHVQNDITSESDIITSAQKTQIKGQMQITLQDFYNIIMQLKGSEVIRDRIGQYNLSAQFVFDKIVKSYIDGTASKVSDGHIDSVSKDIYNIARQAASEGKSQKQIESKLTDAYADISRNRAKTVARTETNRIFTRAQYEADREFIGQNDLTAQAFKEWHTRSGNPCEFCQELEDEGPVPFDNSFRDIGDEIALENGKSYTVGFESLEAGNLHPNCSCDYDLVINQ